jgi:hypothetical protein
MISEPLTGMLCVCGIGMGVGKVGTMGRPRARLQVVQLGYCGGSGCSLRKSPQGGDQVAPQRSSDKNVDATEERGCITIQLPYYAVTWPGLRVVIMHTLPGQKRRNREGNLSAMGQKKNLAGKQE